MHRAPRPTLALIALAALAASPACAGKIACADLGSDWTTCPAPHGDICVRKGSEGQCAAISGSTSSSTSSSGGTGCTFPGEVKCAGVCVDKRTDNTNCGECGTVCNVDIGETCFAGTCK